MKEGTSSKDAHIGETVTESHEAQTPSNFDKFIKRLIYREIQRPFMDVKNIARLVVQSRDSSFRESNDSIAVDDCSVYFNE
jgi:hypothetical protein